MILRETKDLGQPVILYAFGKSRLKVLESVYVNKVGVFVKRKVCANPCTGIS
jgi:hypothetical protein